MHSWNLPAFFISSPICPHNFSFQRLSLYFLLDMSYNSSHLRNNSFNFLFISEEKPDSTCCKQTLEAYWMGCWTVHVIRIEQVQTRSVLSNILAWRRRQNRTETWRRRFCQCEHIRLNTYEKILLNGVNQPILCYMLTVHGVNVLRQAEVQDRTIVSWYIKYDS